MSFEPSSQPLRVNLPAFFSPGEIDFLATDDALPQVCTLIDESLLELETINEHAKKARRDRQAKQPNSEAENKNETTTAEEQAELDLAYISQVLVLMRYIHEGDIYVLPDPQLLGAADLSLDEEPTIQKPALEPFHYLHHVVKAAPLLDDTQNQQGELPLYFFASEYANLEEDVTRSTLMMNGWAGPGMLVKARMAECIGRLNQFLEGNELRDDLSAIKLHSSLEDVMDFLNRDYIAPIFEEVPQKGR